jgi:alanine dehydrogenase
MAKNLTLGLGNIRAEPGEIRAFLPDFVGKMSLIFSEVVLETNYGSKMGYKPDAYTKYLNINFGGVEEVYAQDIVLVLRYPPQECLERMPPTSCLISMCHFPTRPMRREFLLAHKINAISLDAIVDDNGQRLVENLKSVAWNGCEISFRVLDKILPPPGLINPHRKPLQITLLGSGGVGAHAAQAAIRYGDLDLWHTCATQNIPGNIVHIIDYDLTPHKNAVRELLKESHLLIDATQRKNPTKIIIPNELIGDMPRDAVILDLSVDPYDFFKKPYEVKAIEGIPQGNLDQYIFSPDDPAWESIPRKLQTQNRRWVVSCYSWPGLHPKACMRRYGNQLSPLLRRFVAAGGYNGINPDGRYHERALARGILKNWV